MKMLTVLEADSERWKEIPFATIIKNTQKKTCYNDAIIC